MVHDTLVSTQPVKAQEKIVLPKKRKYAGRHVVAEFWDGEIIEDAEDIEYILIEAANRANSNAFRVASHKFSPHGITAFVLLAESHLSIHSWPEINYLAIDIFTCGEHTLPYEALEYLKEVYKPKRVEIREIKRGKIR